MKPPPLEDFDFVIVFGSQGDKFGLALPQGTIVTAVEITPEQADDLAKRLADLIFTKEPAKETK